MNEGTDQKPNTRTGRRSIILILFFLVVSLCGLLWFITRPQEPTYQGKPLSFWLSLASEKGLDEKDPEVIRCRDAVRAMGTNAIPTLLRILRARDSALKIKAMYLAVRVPYVRIPIHSAEEQRDKAAAGFTLLGDLATNAVPALIDISRDQSALYSQDIAENVLMSLYPAKSVAVPYWLPETNRAAWYFRAGMALSRRMDLTNASLAYSQAIELDPKNLSAWLYRAGTRVELRDFIQAKSDYDQVIQLSPTNSDAIAGRGLCNFALKDFRNAEADFSAALNIETNDPNSLNYRGLARANLRDFDGALADFDQAIDMASHQPAFFRNRAMVQMIQGEYESALEDAVKSTQLDRKDPITWVVRGRIQTALKNFQAAITNADKALQLHPKDPADAYTCRATAYMCIDEFAKSAADVEEALKFNPTNASAFLVRGFLKVKQAGEDDAVLAEFERAVESNPKTPETHGMLGLFQYRAHQWEAALSNCRKALQLGALPYKTSYHTYIWLIRAQSGEQEAANQELQSFLKAFDDGRTNEWSAINGNFLLGILPETNYFNLAITAAKRPSAITNQIADSFFYAAMKRKLAGDKAGAAELLQKCLDTKEDNAFSYMMARVELRALQQRF